MPTNKNAGESSTEGIARPDLRIDTSSASGSTSATGSASTVLSSPQAHAAIREKRFDFRCDSKRTLGKGVQGAVVRGLIMDAEGRVKAVAVKRMDDRELRIHQLLASPHVSKNKSGLPTIFCHTWPKAKSEMTVAMSHCELGSLSDQVRSMGDKARVSAGANYALQVFVLRALADISKTLAKAHARGVIHCDIKPQNILLDSDCRAYLCDFGHSLLLNDKEKGVGEKVVSMDDYARIIGTLFYAAPEDIAQFGADSDDLKTSLAADVWALGVMLSELLQVGGHVSVVAPQYKTAPRANWVMLAYQANASAKKMMNDPGMHKKAVDARIRLEAMMKTSAAGLKTKLSRAEVQTLCEDLVAACAAPPKDRLSSQQLSELMSVIAQRLPDLNVKVVTRKSDGRQFLHSLSVVASLSHISSLKAAAPVLPGTVVARASRGGGAGGGAGAVVDSSAEPDALASRFGRRL